MPLIFVAATFVLAVTVTVENPYRKMSVGSTNFNMKLLPDPATPVRKQFCLLPRMWVTDSFWESARDPASSLKYLENSFEYNPILLLTLSLGLHR